MSSLNCSVTLFALLYFSGDSLGQGLDGFNLSRTSIPVSEIPAAKRGNARDGIPAMTKPKFAAASKI